MVVLQIAVSKRFCNNYIRLDGITAVCEKLSHKRNKPKHIFHYPREHEQRQRNTAGGAIWKIPPYDISSSTDLRLTIITLLFSESSHESVLSRPLMTRRSAPIIHFNICHQENIKSIYFCLLLHNFIFDHLNSMVATCLEGMLYNQVSLHKTKKCIEYNSKTMTVREQAVRATLKPNYIKVCYTNASTLRNKSEYLEKTLQRWIFTSLEIQSRGLTHQIDFITKFRLPGCTISKCERKKQNQQI